jgi:hypothetical protein
MSDLKAFITKQVERTECHCHDTSGVPVPVLSHSTFERGCPDTGHFYDEYKIKTRGSMNKYCKVFSYDGNTVEFGYSYDNMSVGVITADVRQFEILFLQHRIFDLQRELS